MIMVNIVILILVLVLFLISCKLRNTIEKQKDADKITFVAYYLHNYYNDYLKNVPNLEYMER
jgi:PBP1b-binding outer membrane lipoprotein LpoB